MRKGKSKITRYLLSLFSLILAGALLFGVIRLNNIDSPKSLYDWAYKKSIDAKNCLGEGFDCLRDVIKEPNRDTGGGSPTDNDEDSQEWSDEDSQKDSGADSEGDNGGESQGETSPDVIDENTPFRLSIPLEDAKTKLDRTPTLNPEKVDYNRQEWKHWSYKERSCWNTREDILARDAKDIELLDRVKQPTDSKDNACYISGGRWIDPYSGVEIKKPRDLDIDHIVPLSYAARQGASTWDMATKESFANDAVNLLSVSASENRAKSDSGPDDYMPTDETYHCNYSKMFINVIDKYNLSVTPADKRALSKGLKSCSN